MDAPFAPRHVDQIAGWAEAQNVAVETARRRFIQGAVVYTIASTPDLAAVLRLFGSGALSLLYGLRRTAGDLDFLCPTEHAPDPAAKLRIHQQLNRVLNDGLKRFVPFDSTWIPILKKAIQVQLVDDLKLGETTWVPLNLEPPASIHTAHLADALAIKLVTIDRPFGAKTSRDQDVYDIADATRKALVNHDDVARCYVHHARQHPLNPEVGAQRERQTAIDYQAKQAGGVYDIPWEQAWDCYDMLRRQMSDRAGVL